jgi:hypothetical protein
MEAVWRNIVAGLPGAPDRRWAITALDEVGLGHRADMWPKVPSGGEAQRAQKIMITEQLTDIGVGTRQDAHDAKGGVESSALTARGSGIEQGEKARTFWVSAADGDEGTTRFSLNRLENPASRFVMQAPDRSFRRQTGRVMRLRISRRIATARIGRLVMCRRSSSLERRNGGQ